MPDETESRWPLPWVRAALDAAILGCLTERPTHGYGIAVALEERGFGRLKGGSLYPALARLEESGAVTTSWVEGHSGPGRREYTLTQAGADRLRADLAAWRGLVGALDPGAVRRPTSTATTPSSLAGPVPPAAPRPDANGVAS